MKRILLGFGIIIFIFLAAAIEMEDILIVMGDKLKKQNIKISD